MQKNSRRPFCAAVAGATLMAHSAFARALGSASDQGSTIAEDEAIRQLLKQRVEVEKRTVGMAVCVVGPKRKSIVTYGRERLSAGAPITADTLFEIGSVTKIFTALLLADMARRGEIGLDDPVTRHLPDDFRLPEPNGRPITLADLATHTSGLPRYPDFPGKPLSPEWREAIPKFTMDEFKAWLAHVKTEPARHPRYYL